MRGNDVHLCTIRARFHLTPRRELRTPVFYVVMPDGQMLGGEINANDHPMVTMLQTALEEAYELRPYEEPPASENPPFNINPLLGPNAVDKFKTFLSYWETRNIGTRSIASLGEYAGGMFTFTLNTHDLRSAHARRRLMNQDLADAMMREVRSMQAAGLIEDSTSPVAANPLVVLK